MSLLRSMCAFFFFGFCSSLRECPLIMICLKTQCTVVGLETSIWTDLVGSNPSLPLFKSLHLNQCWISTPNLKLKRLHYRDILHLSQRRTRGNPGIQYSPLQRKTHSGYSKIETKSKIPPVYHPLKLSQRGSNRIGEAVPPVLTGSQNGWS
ncbi:hypothetical protein M432DRAFT_601955, partial [Thermoascus aurantiacus ATCC 26904]